MSLPVVPMTIPALPRSSVPSVVLNQAPQITTPTKSSPAQNSAICDNTEFQDIRGAALTPPDTTNLQHSTTAKDEPPATPPQAVRPEAPEDPFITTPIRENQDVANPAAVALSQISAIIQANLSHPRIANIEPPREDRLNQTVTAHNAQGLFVKEAKVFVANLSNLRTNDQLEVSVGAVFNQFGPCIVIIKRDRNHQPMGFVQYHLVQDAEVAMANANGCLIDGRVIRLEWASARQELIISLMTNESLTEQAVRQALAGRGPIDSVKPTGPSAGQGQASTAWLVGFVYYADCKEAIRLMRENETYRVVPAPKIQRQAPYPVAPPRTPQGDLYMDNDSRSIFLGSLPDSVTEEELRELFAYLGTIVSCNIISKPMTTGGMNTFAFLEFKYAGDAASAAITTQLLRGEPIRVERKQYAQRRASRVASAAARFPGPFAMRPQYFQQYAAGPSMSPYHPANPYNLGHQGFTVSDYNTTPPAPVCMGQYAQYTSPAPRMRHHQSYYGLPQMSPSMHYGNTGPPNQDAYGQQQANFVQMNAITEEQDGCVFD